MKMRFNKVASDISGKRCYELTPETEGDRDLVCLLAGLSKQDRDTVRFGGVAADVNLDTNVEAAAMIEFPENTPPCPIRVSA